jgi:hypothetical protein
MTRTLRLAVIGTATLMLAACGPAGSGPSAPPPTTAAPAASASITASAGPSPTRAPSPAAPILADGRSPMILSSIDVAHRTMTFDLIELYLGTQAAVEWRKDHPGQTELPPLNGHYMRNNNTKLRTLAVAAEAVITVLDINGDPTGVIVDLAGLASRPTPNKIFWITVKDDTITKVDEQFFP